MNQEKKFLALAEQPVGRLLMQYAIPAITAMIASSLYNIVDGIFIGQAMGENAISGLALTSPLMNLTAAFGSMVGVGGSTIMSVRLGQKDYQTARLILGNIVMMNIVLGLSLGVTLIFFLNPILRFFGASDATLPFSHEYMLILLSFNAVTHMYFGLNAMLRSTNRPRTAMYATFTTVFINTLLDALFILVFRWGIAGAAWATAISQAIVLLWQIRNFRRKDDIIRLERSIFKPSGRIMREAITIGLPQFLINACACLVSICFTRAMSTYGGDVAVGAYGIIGRLHLLVVFIVIGINQALQPIAGYNYGAQLYTRLVNVLKYAIIAATAVSTCGFLLGTFLAGEFVSLFAADAPEMVKTATHGLRISVLIFPFIGMQIVSGSFFQSIGYPGKSIFLSLTRQLIFLLPGLYILPHLFSDPLEGVWYSMPISDAAATLLSAYVLTAEVRRLRRATDGTPLKFQQDPVTRICRTQESS